MMDGNPDQGGIRYPWAEAPAPGAATQIAPGVLWMRLPLPMALDHVNAYALDEGDGWTLIDSGLDNRKARAIWAELLAGPLGGRPIKRVIVTHHHPDHIGLAGWFQAEHGAELWTTRTAWLFARMQTLDVQERPSPETIAFWRGAGMDPDLLARRAEERPFNFADVVAPLPLGYRRIQDGARLTIGGREWDVHFGNGHAPDHATFWEVGGDLVIGGDQMLPSISPNLGVYATEPEADPVADWIETCERLLPLARPEQLVLPGHKLPFTGLPLRLRQKIDNHHAALERLLAHLDRPRTAAECFPALFKRHIDDGVYGLALVEAVGHLNHLLQTGKVTRRRRDDGAWLWERVERA
jgi:glyoxylase-like metal-dependent hydrolase (beta-lactamase superfamily II)